MFTKGVTSTLVKFGLPTFDIANFALLETESIFAELETTALTTSSFDSSTIVDT